MTGCCRFCGQIGMTDYKDITEAEANERATLSCNCYDAQKYQQKRAAADMISEELKELCCDDDNGLKPLDESTVDIALSCVEQMVDGELRKATFETAGKGKLLITGTADGKFTVQRQKTVKQKRQAE